MALYTAALPDVPSMAGVTYGSHRKLKENNEIKARANEREIKRNTGKKLLMLQSCSLLLLLEQIVCFNKHILHTE